MRGKSGKGRRKIRSPNHHRLVNRHQTLSDRQQNASREGGGGRRRRRRGPRGRGGETSTKN